MAQLYTEDGDEIEALTKDEADAKLAEAMETAKAEAEASFKEELAKKEEELNKLRDKDNNFANLRKKAEGKEEEQDQFAKKIAELEGKIEEAKGAGTKVFLDSVKEKAVLQLSGNDPELAKKIAAEYSILNLPEANEEQVVDRVRRAYKLAADGAVAPDVFRGGFTPPMGGGRSVGSNKSEGTPSPELEEFSRRFGISGEDYKTFGSAKTTKA